MMIERTSLLGAGGVSSLDTDHCAAVNEHMERHSHLSSTAVVVRAGVRAHWKSWLFLGVVVGFVAAGAIGAAAGARRTASAFDRYTKWTNASDVTLFDTDGSDPLAALAVTDG